MTKPEERGSRGTGSDEPSGGPVDRPSGSYRVTSRPAHDEGGSPTSRRYQRAPGRQPGCRPTRGDKDGQAGEGGDAERTGGAVNPSRTGSKSPGDAGVHASPAAERRRRCRSLTATMTGAGPYRRHRSSRGQTLAHHWSRGTSKSAHSARQTSRVDAVLDGLRSGAPAEAGQHVVDEQRRRHAPTRTDPRRVR